MAWGWFGRGVPRCRLEPQRHSQAGLHRPQGLRAGGGGVPGATALQWEGEVVLQGLGVVVFKI